MQIGISLSIPGLAVRGGGSTPATTPEVEVITRDSSTIVMRDGSTLVAASGART